MSWLRFYFRWNGRIDRAGYIGGLFVVNSAAAVLGLFFALIFLGRPPYEQQSWVFWAPLAPAIVASSALTARRLHDLGVSARWLILFVPYALVIGFVAVRWPGRQSALLAAPYMAAAVWLYAAPGQTRANKYGTPDQASASPTAKA